MSVHAALENTSKSIAVVYNEDDEIWRLFLLRILKPASNLHAEHTREMPLSGREPKYVSEAHVSRGVL
jgi:hypothetical protein